jgi:hypothetical protein
MQLRAVVGRDRAKVRRELHWWRLVGNAVNPYRALAAGRRIVDALYEVEGEGGAVRCIAHPGGPPPLGHACVVAGGVVDHGECID